jgi:Uri superfamily endonuclease
MLHPKFIFEKKRRLSPFFAGHMQGAYLLYIEVKRPIRLEIGAMGRIAFPAGRYVYVGSAHKGIEARLARHRRLAEQKSGKLHWHIDYLLTNMHVRWMKEEAFENGDECELSQQIASKKGVAIPAPGFGSSDCRSGCKSHLYFLQ